MRRCGFEKCKRPATAEGYWPTLREASWYCRIHLNMLRRVSGVREVVATRRIARGDGEGMSE